MKLFHIILLIIVLILILYLLIINNNIENLAFKNDDSNIIINIISLLNNEERTKNITDNILNCYNNYPTYIFPAIKGKDLTEEDKKYFIDKGYLSPDYFEKWNYGQRGCALSHLLLIQDIAKNGNPDKYYIIVEDDVFLKDDFEKMINKVINESKKIDWDQIMLHNDKEINIYPNEFYENENENENKGFLKKCKQCVGGVGYMITKKNAQNILDIILPLKYPIDEDFRFYINKQYGMEEPIVHIGNNIKTTISE